MSMTQIEAMSDRLAREMVTAYTRRKEFEAGVMAKAFLGGKKKEPAAAADATDENLAEFMAFS